ncbi:MAG: NAD(P)H-quinone oxidoreductase [Pseudomonadota bacterium]
MRTIETESYGGPEVLSLGERSVPQPKDHEIIIKVTSAGVNGPDIIQRRGHYPPPKGASDLLGLEVSGTVHAIGKDVARWQAGDTVCALTHGGGYAEFVAVDGHHCLSIPEGVSLQDAGGLPETYFTVWSNLFYQQTIKPGSRLLVHGGAGGIGTTAIQLGAALGMDVFTTCRGPEKAKFCLELGATRAIDYSNEDFVEILREAGGANLIVDIMGGDYIARNLKATAPDARIIQLAFRAGSKVEVDLMAVMLKRLTITGSTLRSRPDAFKAAIAADLQAKVWPLFAKGKLKPLTHKVFAMDEARDAHEMMEASTHVGKILLKIN